MAEPGRGGYSSIAGMDPGADWLLGPGLRDFLPPGGDAVIPFIIQVQDASALRVLNGLLRAPGEREDLRVTAPRRAKSTQRDVRPGEPIVAYARKAFFDELARGGFEGLRAGVKRIQLGLPLPVSALAAWDSLGEPPVRPPENPWPRGTVVIGVIDDGIAFAHRRFQASGLSSRVEAYWNQDGLPPGNSVPYGREFGRQDINALLQQCSQGDWTDEDKLYRRAGLNDMTLPYHQTLAWRAAHGTHVLDLAAGYDPAENRADRPIIAVQLRVASTASQSGAGLETDVLQALDYIRDRALLLTREGEPPLPLVVNFSYGTHAGPHDGTSLIENAIDGMVASSPAVQVVLPAGNSHDSRCHAAVTFAAAGDTVALRLRVQPDDRTPSTVEIWTPYAGPAGPAQSRVSVSVEMPDGSQSGWIEEGDALALELGPPGAPYGLVNYVFVPSNTERGVFRMDLQPTTRIQPQPDPGPVSPSTATAPAGVWVIRLRNAGLARSDTVHAWVERDDKLFGYPRRGRQSYFDEPCYQRWDAQGRLIEEDMPGCPVQRAGMLNGIGAGRLPVVIGGYVRKDLKPARYSAGGPVTPAQGEAPNLESRKPDALAVSDDSRVHGGVLAAGSRSGSVLAMNGTSVAAPQVTRWVACQLAAGLPADRDAVKQRAMADEAALPLGSPQLPDKRGGWGRINKDQAQGPGARYWP